MNFKEPINIIFILFVLFIFMVFGVVYPELASAAEKQDKSARRAELMTLKIKQEAEQEKLAMQEKFNQEKKELEEKVLSKDQQLSDLDKSIQTSQKKIKSTENENIKVTAEKKAIETKFQQTHEQLDAAQKELLNLKAQLNQVQADLKLNDMQRKVQVSNIAQTAKNLSVCEQKNSKLHQFGTELITLYDKPGSYAAVMRQESFFQLKRVELENILQGYQDKLNEEHLVLEKH